MTKIIWYKYFGAKFAKPVRQSTGSKSTGLVSPACFKTKHFLVRPIQPDHGARTPHRCIRVSPASSTA